MKKITLTILATILLFSFGCSKKPQTIEEKAKAEVQSFYDAIDDGKFLSHTYNSDFIEDRVFLNQMVNTAAKNIDEDIFNQAMQTIGSLAEVVRIQSDNITTYIVKTLIAANEESGSNYSEEEILANETLWDKDLSYLVEGVKKYVD
jgi:PBP1b-binding outer membrane lipoprotein LpoB